MGEPTEQLSRRKRFAYGGESAQGFESDHWKVGAASVTGPSHRASASGCDDAAAATTEGDWLVAVVCDGAGSAVHGAIGAALAARTLMQRISSQLAHVAEPELTDLDLIAFTDEALVAAHDCLAAEAKRLRVPIAALSTTVVGVLTNGVRGTVFHVGDGGVIAARAAGPGAEISLGTPSEYVNETYFLTDDNWRDSLVRTPLGPFDYILLMTDGVTPLAFDRRTINSGFTAPVAEFLEENPIEEGVSALFRLLDRDTAQQAVSDDKTLLWARPLGKVAPDIEVPGIAQDKQPPVHGEIDVVLRRIIQGVVALLALTCLVVVRLTMPQWPSQLKDRSIDLFQRALQKPILQGDEVDARASRLTEEIRALSESARKLSADFGKQGRKAEAQDWQYRANSLSQPALPPVTSDEDGSK
ncbi:MAG: protein phosphatase 2C domain-containing protein [Bryobacteraceae bacterium]|nr:protein phosphatase 2C domain-containing protein [Bryobacteraceae bacterium]